MRRDELAAAVRPETIAERVVANKPKRARRGEHAGHLETVREAEHRGHRIVVRTTYVIEVDGMPVEGHLGVTNDGRVHYHPVPNLSFPSAVDMVRQLIDSFPDDFPEPADTSGAAVTAGAHAGHGAPKGAGSKKPTTRAKKAAR